MGFIQQQGPMREGTVTEALQTRQRRWKQGRLGEVCVQACAVKATYLNCKVSAGERMSMLSNRSERFILVVLFMTLM